MVEKERLNIFFLFFNEFNREEISNRKKYVGT
jgi:hypothetical protein